MPADALIISACTLVNALGRGTRACFDALEEARGGLRTCDFDDADIDTWIGRVDGLEDEPVAAGLDSFDCRNNRLAQLGLRQDAFADRVAEVRGRHGAARIGVFIGTSTSGVLQAELAYRHRDPTTGALPADFSYFGTQNAMAPAEFTRRFLSLEGPVMAVSTACSSSAKVFASAYRHIEAGLCDAAVVGGVDSLCFSTLYGFSSLGLVSDRPCRPWDAERSGMNIGEGRGLRVAREDGWWCGGGRVARLRGKQRRLPHVIAPSRRCGRRGGHEVCACHGRGSRQMPSTISTCTGPVPGPTTNPRIGRS